MLLKSHKHLTTQIKMSKEYSEEERFRINIFSLAELLASYNQYCWDNGHEIIAPPLLEMAKKYLEKLDPTSLIDNFIQYSNTYWETIPHRMSIF